MPLAPVARVETMVQALRLEGHEVILITRHFNSPTTDWHSLITPTTEREVAISQEDGVRVIRVPLRERRLLARARTGLEMNNLKRVQVSNRLHYLWNGWPLYHDMTAWLAPYLNQVIKELQGANVLIVSCPPFSGLAVGLLLREALNCGLIADYRDMWTSGGQELTKSQKEEGFWVKIRKKRERDKEAVILGTYDKVVTVNQLLANELQEALKLKKPVELIPNGINPNWRKYDDYDVITNSEVPTLVHAGALYAAQDADNLLFKGLKLYSERYPTQPIVIQFIGSEAREVERRKNVTKENNTVSIRIIDRLSTAKYHQALLAAHGVIALDYGIGNEGVASAKAYDYVGCGRPIIYVINETNDSTLASVLGHGPTQKTTTEEEVCAAIKVITSEWTPTQKPDREETKHLYTDQIAKRWGLLLEGKPLEAL